MVFLNFSCITLTGWLFNVFFVDLDWTGWLRCSSLIYCKYFTSLLVDWLTGVSMKCYIDTHKSLSIPHSVNFTSNPPVLVECQYKISSYIVRHPTDTAKKYVNFYRHPPSKPFNLHWVDWTWSNFDLTLCLRIGVQPSVDVSQGNQLVFGGFFLNSLCGDDRFDLLLC